MNISRMGKEPCENMELFRIDKSLLFNKLADETGPMMEAVLLKYITGLKHLPSASDKLFAIHFSLFHALYRLKHTHGPEGYYFHLDPMRIRMIKIPVEDSCHYYLPENGSFCTNEAHRQGYCIRHGNNSMPEDKAFSFDPLLDFYSNPENISFCREEIFEKLMNGFILYSMKKGAIEDAMKFFGLSRPTRKIIKKKYHQLARKMHPDMNSGDNNMMKKLNSSYQVLMEVFVV